MHIMYVTQHIHTYFIRKKQMILKKMSWKLSFTLQEITVGVSLLALETVAFGVKEPVAG